MVNESHKELIINPQKTSKFIVYACPTGELNNQLENYFKKSRQLFGENSAHKYMPHCTLTGFFTDQISSTAIYIQALEQAYLAANKNNLSIGIKIKQLAFRKNWHGLELQADGLKKLITNFTELENSITRQEKLRLKDLLHLSLAYDFTPESEAGLKNLATAIIDLKAKVNWELRFYQKNDNWTWKCLKSWHIRQN